MHPVVPTLIFFAIQVQAFIPLTQTPPLKVALLVEPTPFNYISGYANRFKEMLKYLKKAGDDVQIVTADSDSNAPATFLDYPISTNRGFSFPWYKGVILTFDFAGATKKISNTFKPDIIHVAAPGCLVFPAIRYARRYNIPLVMSYHTNVPEYTKSYFKFPGSVALSHAVLYNCLKYADMILTTSPQLKEDLHSIGLKKIDVWQKGINAERFSPSFATAAMRDRLSGGHPEAPLLVYVGRLGAEKKLASLRTVLDKIPNVRLALVGGGPAKEELEKFFKDYPVVFTGPMQGDELSAAYASTDIFCMPSDSETLGFVVLEAMASGVPVVGVAAGGVIDLIDSGSTGYLVSNTDGMEEFSVRIKELAGNVEIRKAMGVNARKWAEGWSWESATSKLRNLQYPQAIENFSRRRAAEADEETDALYEQFGELYRPDLSN